MSNYSKSVSTGDWELVYDASANGDFNGYVQVTNGTDAFVYVGNSAPSITAIGGIADIHPRQITALASSSDKIYAKRGSGVGVVSLMSINTVQIVAGQSVTYTEDWNAALTSSYQKVATTTASTRSLRMSAACNATAYDIEYQVVASGAAAPTTTGQALLAGDDFLAGIPVGDIYARSATAQKLIVWRA